jgi:DNA-binding NtrC family response regulator
MDRAAGKILIVDDEPPLLRMLGLYLTRKGYEVMAADTTEEAWAMVKADPSAYAVAVLDGSMPGMSMNDLALRMLRANPALCVLTASGYPVDMTALEAEFPGRVDFLLKPFTPEMLAATVRRLLAAEEETL